MRWFVLYFSLILMLFWFGMNDAWGLGMLVTALTGAFVGAMMGQPDDGWDD